MSQPLLVLLLSGKRKCGKDFITKKLETLLADKCCVIRISEPIKRHYAKTFNLDLDELLSDSDYKEKYRLEMIDWSEEVRRKDYGYFCKAACDAAEKKPIWIVSDIRRKTDVKWFKDTFGNKVKLIRITADDAVREARGWMFAEGVDDVASECDLDDFKDWNLILPNNNMTECKESIDKIVELIGQK